MKQVLKWNVPVDDRIHEIGGGRIIHAACQYGPESVQVWTDEEYFPDDHHNPYPLPKQRVMIVGTGHSFHDSGEAICSVVDPSGLVWHVVTYID